MEKTGEITERTPDAEREKKDDTRLKKDAQFRDAARTLKNDHKRDDACPTSR